MRVGGVGRRSDMRMGVGQGVLAVARCRYLLLLGPGGPSQVLALAVGSFCFRCWSCPDYDPDGCGVSAIRLNVKEEMGLCPNRGGGGGSGDGFVVEGSLAAEH